MVMLSDGVTLWHACLRSFLSELGDKTFFLALVFAAWCPWEGVRSGHARGAQLILIFFASLTALSARLILAWRGHDKRWACSCEVLFFTMSLILGTKARMDLSKADSRVEKNPFLIMDEEQKEKLTTSAQWNQQAFGAISAAASHEQVEYGTAVPAAPSNSADGIFSERVSDEVVSNVIAFLLPLVLMFLAEGEDKSQSMLGPKPAKLGSDMIIGSIFGFVPAMVLALALGYLMERQLCDQRMLFFVSCVFWGLALVTFSQAALHSASASLPAAKSALLAVVESVRTQVPGL